MTRTSRVQPAQQAKRYRGLHLELRSLHRLLQASRPNPKRHFLKRYAIPVFELHDTRAKCNQLSSDSSKSSFLPMTWSRQ